MVPEITCPDPEFVFDKVSGQWSECKKCTRLAWEHEQSDPFQDAVNWIDTIAGFSKPGDHPPAMKEIT